MTTDDNDNTGPEVELFDAWVNKNYGGNSRTKTITNEKYGRICKLIRGEDPNSNAKFRFWVRNKGFRLLRHDKLTDEILDDPSGSLFVSLHAKESSTPMGERSIEKFLRTNLPAISFFRKVAIVEEFYGIIKCSHVDEKGVHAGQKKTYRLVSDTYAFLPREVITFYLLNCKTCKPRIQKYGPIPSKIRLNNLGPRKTAPTKDSASNYTTPENAEGKEEANTVPHQVIRPSPKRYRPTFVDMPGEERYSKIPNMEYKDLASEEPPLLKILDGRMAPHPRREYPSPPYSSHSPPKIVDSGTPSGTPRKQEEEKCPKNYYYYPTSYIVANPSPRMEHADYELIPERAQEEIDCMMNVRRERIRAFEREVLHGPHANYTYMHPERTTRYFHGGCRMQPYKLHDKYHGDTPHTLQKLVYETRQDRDIVAAARRHYDSSAYAAYVAGHRRMDMEKMTDGQRAYEDNWNCAPKPSPELRHQHDKLVIPIHTTSNEMRELYAFDYAKDRSRMIAQRKENDYYSVHQYHRVVCDTVNSSLASLCYISEDERDGGSHSLRIPDPSKISKVLQETDSDKVQERSVEEVKVVDDEK